MAAEAGNTYCNPALVAKMAATLAPPAPRLMSDCQRQSAPAMMRRMKRSNRGTVKAASPRAALHTTPWAIISSARSAAGGDRATCRDLPAGHLEALPPAAQRLRRAFGSCGYTEPQECRVRAAY